MRKRRIGGSATAGLPGAVRTYKDDIPLPLSEPVECPGCAYIREQRRLMWKLKNTHLVSVGTLMAILESYNRMYDIHHGEEAHYG